VACPVSAHATEPKAAKVQNNNQTTHIHTINHRNIFPKKDQTLTSLGALSNIATSGF
jgi:hypothetical protein